jgi:hypothetical protein
MKKIKISNFFYFFALSIIVGSFGNYFLFIKTMNQVETTTKNIYTKYTKELSNNITKMILNSTNSNLYDDLKKDTNLREKLNKQLSFFITNRYKYIYVVTKKDSC